MRRRLQEGSWTFQAIGTTHDGAAIYRQFWGCTDHLVAAATLGHGNDLIPIPFS